MVCGKKKKQRGFQSGFLAVMGVNGRAQGRNGDKSLFLSDVLSEDREKLKDGNRTVRG